MSPDRPCLQRLKHKNRLGGVSEAFTLGRPPGKQPPHGEELVSPNDQPRAALRGSLEFLRCSFHRSADSPWSEVSCMRCACDVAKRPLLVRSAPKIPHTETQPCKMLAPIELQYLKELAAWSSNRSRIVFMSSNESSSETNLEMV